MPDAEWESVIPKAGQSVIVRSIPQGGGGQQGGGKQAAQIAAMLALTVAAIYVGGPAGAGRFALLGSPFLGITGLSTGTVLAAGLLVAGSLAANGPIPAPLPRRSLSAPMRTLPEAA